MVCKKCGAETLADGAVYCAACGTRLDGKIQCENCNQFNDGTNAFCVYCGTRIDGKTVCKTCGELMEGAFCAKCGTAVHKVATTEKKVKSANPNKQGLWDKIFGLTSGGVVLLGAVFALIFVFLIGFVSTVTTSYSVTTHTGPMVQEKTNIYYFFGKVYKDIGDFKTAVANMQCEEFLIGNTYVYAVISTILAVATIACVVGFFIPAVVSYIRYATGKTEKMDSKWALLTMFSFLGGVAALFAQNYANTETVVTFASVQTSITKITLSGATVAGVVLCIIFAVLWFAAKMVSYGKRWKEKAFIKKAVCVTLSVCLLSAFFAVWQHLAQAMEIITLTNADSTTSSLGNPANYVISKFSPSLYNEYFVMLAEDILGESALVKLEPNLMAFYACNIVMIFVSIAGVVCVVGNLQSRCLATQGKKYAGLAFSIVLFALTVVALIMFIVMQTNANVIFEHVLLNAMTALEINYGYGTCIAVMILAGLNLAVSITQTVFERQKME